MADKHERLLNIVNALSEIASALSEIASATLQLCQELTQQNAVLFKRQAEAATIIEGLLSEREEIAKRSIWIAGIREAARRFIRAKNAAMAKSHDDDVKALLTKYEAECRSKRSLNKAIAVDLGMTPQAVGKARRRIERKK